PPESVCAMLATYAASRHRQIVPCCMISSVSHDNVSRLVTDRSMCFATALDKAFENIDCMSAILRCQAKNRFYESTQCLIQPRRVLWNMTPTDQKTEDVSPTEVPEDLPLPSDPKVIFLGGLFVLALLAAAYVAKEIVLPFVFAVVLKLLLQPTFRILERLHVPRILASLLLI